MSQPLSFGALLKRLRGRAGLTQEQLAERAGYSPVYISKLERGDRLPLAPTVELLADALALTPNDRAALLSAAQVGRAASSTSQRSARSLTPSPGQHPIPLVGRAHELALLDRHLAGGGPPLLVLAGEPGIGKTRLLCEAAERARRGEWCVLEGGCARRGAQEPYVPVLTALAGRVSRLPAAQLRRELEGCAWLVRLLPELAETTLVPAPTWTLPSEQERRLMFAAVGRFLSNVAGPAGTLLLLDDLQWAGLDALALLAFLVRLTEGSLRVVGAYRSTEVRPKDPLAITSADLARDGLVAQTELGPLTRQEAEELLSALLEGAEDDGMIRRVAERSGGLPFFLVSCARGLRQGTLDGDAAESVPWDAAQSIRLRVAALPEPARALLGVAAVIGRQVSAILLGAVTGRPEGELLDLLEGICESRLLVEQSADAFEFAHDLHRRVAEAMEREAVEYRAEMLAFHFEQGGEPARAVRCLERAAERATRMGAFAEAQHHLQHAITLAPEEEHTRLYEQAGDSVLWAFGYHLYRAAFGRWRQYGARDPLVGARLVRKILFTCIRALIDPRPSDEELADLQAQARRLAETIGDEGERWRLRVSASLPPIWRDQVTPEEASEARSVALAAAAYFEARGDWVSFSMALDGYTNIAMAAELIEVAKRRLSAPDLPVMERGDALGMLAMAYFRTGDFGRSIAIMREALEHVQPGESLEPFAQAARYAAFAAWFSGRWGEIDDIMAAVEGDPQTRNEMMPGVYSAAL